MTYSVSGGAVSIVSAKTPFDDNAAAREAFLKWFERGLRTGLAGDPPLMIEWNNTPQARAGQTGYDFGLEQGRKYREGPSGARQRVMTAPIPIGGL